MDLKCFGCNLALDIRNRFEHTLWRRGLKTKVGTVVAGVRQVARFSAAIFTLGLFRRGQWKPHAALSTKLYAIECSRRSSRLRAVFV